MEQDYTQGLSETNYLELKSDPAEATNAAIEEYQKALNSEFAARIQEASRAATERSKRFKQVSELLGTAVKFKQQVDEYKDVNSQIEAQGLDKESLKEAEEALKKQKALELKDQKEIDKIDGDVQSQKDNTLDDATSTAAEKNAAINITTEGEFKEAAVNNLHALKEKSVGLIQTQKDHRETTLSFIVNLPEEKKKEYYVDGKFIGISYIDAIKNEDWELARKLKNHHNATNFIMSGYKGRSREEMLKLAQTYQKEWKLIRDTQIRIKQNEDEKLYKETQIHNTNIGVKENGIEYVMGTKENPNSGFLARHSKEPETMGTAVNKLVDRLTKGVEDSTISSSDIKALREGEFVPKGGGKPVKLADSNNKEFKRLDAELAKLERKSSKEEIEIKEEEKQIKLNQRVAELEKISSTLPEHELQTKVAQIATELNIPWSDKRLDPLKNLMTGDDQNDLDVMQSMRQDMKNNLPLGNWEKRLRQIKDKEVRDEFTEEVKEYTDNGAKDKQVSDFRRDIGPLVGEILQEQGKTPGTRSDTYNTTMDNLEAEYKIAYRKHAKIAESDKEAELLALDELRTKYKASPESYSKFRGPKIDTDYVGDIEVATAYIGKDKEVALNSKEFYPGEEKYLKQEAKNLEGKGEITGYYLQLQKHYPHLSRRELVQKRLAATQGNEGKEVDFKLPERDLPDTDDQKALLDSNKVSPSRTLKVLTKEENYAKVLAMTKKGGALASTNRLVLPGGQGLNPLAKTPLQRRGINKPLDQLTLNEINELVTNDYWGDAEFGLYGIKGKELKLLLETVDPEDRDRVFDEDFQNELLVRTLRMKAADRFSLSSNTEQKMKFSSLRDRDHFKKIVEMLPDDQEKEFFNSPFNQLDALLPGVQTEVTNKLPGWFPLNPLGTLKRNVDKRFESNAEAFQERKRQVLEERKRKREEDALYEIDN
tara:strand:- start:519 stop:3329 length:2811 start_codon:yes stop_codon:yes gene_type:complete